MKKIIILVFTIIPLLTSGFPTNPTVEITTDEITPEVLKSRLVKFIFNRTLSQFRALSTADPAPTVFISYAWNSGHDDYVRNFARDLRKAGLNSQLDVDDNIGFGATVDTHINLLDDMNYIILFGSRRLLERCNDEHATINVELQKIRDRFDISRAGVVQTILLDGSIRETLPEFLHPIVALSVLNEEFNYHCLLLKVSRDILLAWYGERLGANISKQINLFEADLLQIDTLVKQRLENYKIFLGKRGSQNFVNCGSNDLWDKFLMYGGRGGITVAKKDDRFISIPTRNLPMNYRFAMAKSKDDFDKILEEYENQIETLADPSEMCLFLGKNLVIGKSNQGTQVDRALQYFHRGASVTEGNDESIGNCALSYAVHSGTELQKEDCGNNIRATEKVMEIIHFFKLATEKRVKLVKPFFGIFLSSITGEKVMAFKLMTESLTQDVSFLTDDIIACLHTTIATLLMWGQGGVNQNLEEAESHINISLATKYGAEGLYVKGRLYYDYLEKREEGGALLLQAASLGHPAAQVCCKCIFQDQRLLCQFF